MSKSPKLIKTLKLVLSASVALTLGGCASVVPYVTDDSRYVVHPVDGHNKQFLNTASNHRAEHDVDVFSREGGYEYALWFGENQAKPSAYQEALDNIKKSQNKMKPGHVFMDTSAMDFADKVDAAVDDKTNINNNDFTLAGKTSGADVNVAMAQSPQSLWERFCNGETLTAAELDRLDFYNPPEHLIETCDGLK